MDRDNRVRQTDALLTLVTSVDQLRVVVGELRDVVVSLTSIVAGLSAQVSRSEHAPAE